jgi:hypothetical protein
MHPTADTTLVMLRESSGAAGDAGRYAAFDYSAIRMDLLMYSHDHG